MSASTFLFATGIENSYPTINSGRTRIDEMEKCGHYTLWQDGLRFTRRRRHKGAAVRPANTHDVARAGALRLGLLPTRPSVNSSGATSCRSSTCATSACPTGSATSRTPTFPSSSPGMRGAFAERFPWVQLYTPVNEMFICAAFSAAYGWWNEQLTSDRAFVTALKHIVKANVLAMGAILDSPRRRHLHPERVLGVLPCREPGCDQAGRVP